MVARPVPYDGFNVFNGNGDLTSLGHANGPPLSPEQAEMPVRKTLRKHMRPLREYLGPYAFFLPVTPGTETSISKADPKTHGPQVWMGTSHCGLHKKDVSTGTLH